MKTNWTFLMFCYKQFLKHINFHKKGDKDNIKNERPVANFWSATKIYERLILQRIQEIENKKYFKKTWNFKQFNRL